MEGCRGTMYGKCSWPSGRIKRRWGNGSGSEEENRDGEEGGGSENGGNDGQGDKFVRGEVEGGQVYEDMEKKMGEIESLGENKENGTCTIMWEGISIREREKQEGSGGRARRREGKCSKDKKVNTEGKYLVDRLEEVGWFIFNGCGKKRGTGRT